MVPRGAILPAGLCRGAVALVFVLADLLAIGCVLAGSPHDAISSHQAVGPAAWQRVGPNTIIHALLVDPRRNTRLFAATAGGALSSDDGGASWQVRNAGLSTTDLLLWNIVSFDSGRRLAAAADDGRVYMSDDGVGHWQPSADVLGPGGVFALAADPLHRLSLLAGATGGIWRSSDGGVRWELVRRTASADVATIAWSSAAPNTAYAGLIPGPGQILASQDGGASWRAASLGMDGAEGVMAIASFQQGGASVFAGTMGHRIWRLDDGARTWRSSSDGIPAGQHGTAFLLTANTLYAGTMGAGIYASHDGGQHWSPFWPPLTGNAAIVLALVRDGDALLAGTAAGIYRLPIGS
jgi:hypothetical protein